MMITWLILYFIIGAMMAAIGFKTLKEDPCIEATRKQLRENGTEGVVDTLFFLTLFCLWPTIIVVMLWKSV